MLNQRSKQELTQWAHNLAHSAQTLAARLPHNTLPLDVKAEVEQAQRWLSMQDVDNRPHILEIAATVMKLAHLRLTWIEETLARPDVAIHESPNAVDIEK